MNTVGIQPSAFTVDAIPQATNLLGPRFGWPVLDEPFVKNLHSKAKPVFESADPPLALETTLNEINRWQTLV